MIDYLPEYINRNCRTQSAHTQSVMTSWGRRDLFGTEHLYGIKTYWSLVHAPGNHNPMDVTLEETQPFPCKSADEWIKKGTQLGRKFPVGWFTVKKDQPLASLGDPFFTHSFRYSKIPFQDLIEAFENLKPAHRNWTGIVVPGAHCVGQSLFITDLFCRRAHPHVL
jgi:hypothetical protein